MNGCVCVGLWGWFRCQSLVAECEMRNEILEVAKTCMEAELNRTGVSMYAHVVTCMYSMELATCAYVGPCH